MDFPSKSQNHLNDNPNLGILIYMLMKLNYNLYGLICMVLSMQAHCEESRAHHWAATPAAKDRPAHASSPWLHVPDEQEKF